MGFVVPKHKRSGVERNRLKRRLRELVRTRLLPGMSPMDVVFRVWPEAYAATFEQLANEVERVNGKLAALFPIASTGRTP